MVRGISKRVSEHILKTTGKFFPVESGELCFRLKIAVFRTEYCFKMVGGNSRSKRKHANWQEKQWILSIEGAL